MISYPILMMLVSLPSNQRGGRKCSNKFYREEAGKNFYNELAQSIYQVSRVIYFVKNELMKIGIIE